MKKAEDAKKEKEKGGAKAGKGKDKGQAKASTPRKKAGGASKERNEGTRG